MKKLRWLYLLICPISLFGQEQFFAPITRPTVRWHALERASDSAYWRGVDCSKMFICLEKGVAADDPSLDFFLKKQRLGRVVGRSLNPDLHNFLVVELPGGSPARVHEIAAAARQQTFIRYAEPGVRLSSGGRRTTTHDPPRSGSACPPNDYFWIEEDCNDILWGLQFIGMDEAWCRCGGGTRQRVAVIDDAVDRSHEDLAAFVREGYDFGNFDNDPSPDDPELDQHGTHVAGIVAAERNNLVGIAGVVGDTVWFAKISKNHELVDAAAVNAINKLVDLPRVRVANMSFGTEQPFMALEDACFNAWAAGKLLIAAAGNNGSSAAFYPAAYPTVMSVSALGAYTEGFFSFSYDYFEVAGYSNFGQTIEICAPGGDAAAFFGFWGPGITSTIPTASLVCGVKYDDLEGTSMAAPHVTGLAALIFDVNPFLKNEQARNILRKTAQDDPSFYVPGSSSYAPVLGWDARYGFGVIDAPAALSAACDSLSRISWQASGSLDLGLGGSVGLSVPLVEGVSYQWLRDGQPISGATKHVLLVSTAGKYTLRINTCGCSHTTSPAVVTTCLPQQAPQLDRSGTVFFCTGESIEIKVINAATCLGCTVYWSTGEQGTTLNAVSGGIYTAFFYNPCGYSPVSLAVVLEEKLPPTAPQISLSGNLTLCNGDSAKVCASNICSDCSVVWSNGKSGNCLSTATSGEFSARQVSAACPNLSSAVSDVLRVSTASTPAALQISVGGGGSNWICTGDSVLLLATGLAADCSVLWSDGQGGESIWTTAAGVFTAVQSHPICGGSPISNSILIENYPPPSIPEIVSLGTDTFCAGQVRVLSVGNLCQNCTPIWSDGSTAPSLNVSTSGSFTVAAARCGQVSGASFPKNLMAIDLPQKPVLSTDNDTSFCESEGSLLICVTPPCPNCIYSWSNGVAGNCLTAGQSQTLLLTASNTCGAATSTVKITKHPSPAQPSVVVLQNCHLLAGNSTAGTWQWLRGGMPLLGATADTLTASVAGFYAVVFTDLNGCSAVSQAIFAQPCTSSDGGEVDFLEPALSIFPNPTGDVRVFVRLENMSGVAGWLMDVEGRRLRQVKFLGGGQVEILNLEGLPAGIYWLRVGDGRHWLAARVVIFL